MLFLKKNISMVISSIFLIFTCCKQKDSIVEVNSNDEMTKYLKSKIQESLRNENVESFKLVNIDSLTEFNIAALTANYLIEQLKKLNKKQNQVGQKIEEAKRLNKLDEIKKEFQNIWDSIKYYNKVSDVIYDSKPDSLKTEYFEYTFLLNTTNKSKEDTVYFYSPKKNRSQFIPAYELIHHIIMVKYKIK